MLDYPQGLTPREKRAQYSKTQVFSASKFLYWPYTIFLNDSFFLNFLISPENRNLEPLTIHYDVGHPIYKTDRVKGRECILKGGIDLRRKIIAFEF